MGWCEQSKLHRAANLCDGAGLKHLAIAGAVLLASCGDDDFPDYRYKMTVIVSTPEGEKAFTSVREVQQEEQSSIQDSSGRMVKTSLRGEAMILDLPGGQTVYALLSKPDNPDQAKYIAGGALLPAVRPVKRDDRFDDLHSESGEYLDRDAAEQQAMVRTVGPRELPRERTVNSLGIALDKPHPLWPMFVTFDDPNDPATIREVSPESIGVERITIEITDEPVTTGIERHLAWLARYQQESRRLSGSSSVAVTTNNLADNLGAGSFRQGI
jgi:hypothetical protein